MRLARKAAGGRQWVRYGHACARDIITPLGPLEVQTPRVNHRRRGVCGERADIFSSKILPPYQRKTKSVEDLAPWLYLKGISMSDFPEALQALLGPGVRDFSANTVVRLKQVWDQLARVQNNGFPASLASSRAQVTGVLMLRYAPTTGRYEDSKCFRPLVGNAATFISD